MMDSYDPKYADFIRISIACVMMIFALVFAWDDKMISPHLKLSPDGRTCISSTSSYSFKTSLGNVVCPLCNFLLAT